MPIRLDGQKLSHTIKQDLKHQIQKLKQFNRKPIQLAVILVGSDPASQVYVRHKEKACAEVGILTQTIKLPENIDQSILNQCIDQLNADKNVHGILCQLPLPKNLSSQEVIERIDPKKDVDGFHPMNIGLLSLGHAIRIPCTPKGIIRLLSANQISIAGKQVVILGRSHLVGKPLLQLMLAEQATVTICHSKTVNLESLTKRADILVAAMGQAQAVQPAWLKPNCVIVDVGIHRQPDGTLCGDVSPATYAISSAYTPVPGGVGPMTIAMLLENTYLSFLEQEGMA